MHTITICPRCGKEFMYHQSDFHLRRVVAMDADTKEPCSFETICQECDDVERMKDDTSGKNKKKALDFLKLQ